MYLSELILSRKESKILKITDTYSLHRLVYSCFEKTREDMQESSGILFSEIEGNALEKRLLILSQKQPQATCDFTIHTKKISEKFFDFPLYRFEITVNPVKRESASRKLIPMRTHEDIANWFSERAHKWGFSIHENTLEVIDMYVDTFCKKNQQLTLGKAKIQGYLKITDKDVFIKTFSLGLGKGKAFACGLLQLHPILA